MAGKRDSLSDAPPEHWLPQVCKNQRMRFGKQSSVGLGIRWIIGNPENPGHGRHRARRRRQRLRGSDAARSAQYSWQWPPAVILIWIKKQRDPARLEGHRYFARSKSAR